MVEFDENLNPIQGGQSGEPKPEGAPLGPTPPPVEPVQPVADPVVDLERSRGEQSRGEQSREEPPFEPITDSPVQPSQPVDDFVVAPPPPPPQTPEPQPVADAPINHPPVKQAGSGILAVLGIIAILAATAIAIVSVVSSNNSSFVISSGQIEGLTVTATGTIDAIPDVAKVTFGITHKASTVGEVEDKINETFDDIEKALKKFKIKDADIKTSNYRIYPEYDYRSKTRRITGYTGTHQQTITIRDLDDVNEIVDAVTDAGANMINNVNFTVDDDEDWNSRARAEAIKKAKAKAKLIADEADIRLGKILSIDQGASYPQPYYREISLDTGFGGGDDEEILPNIEPASREIQATVTLVYEIK